MAIVWVIESPQEAKNHTLAAALMGDYAVRLFASVDSFRRLARLRRFKRPDVLVVDADQLSQRMVNLNSELDLELPKVPRLYVTSPENVEAMDSSWTILTRPVDSLELSKAIGALVRRQRDSAHHPPMKYRDIIYDLDRFSLTMAAGEEEEILPPKEAKLIKLFLKFPAKCLSRDEIKQAVWGDLAVSPRTIDSHISRLRKKLDPSEVSIKNVYGGGYILD